MYWYVSLNSLQLKFPIDGKHAEQAYKLIQNKRFSSNTEEFPASLEIIEDKNVYAYIDLLLDQHKNSDKYMREYIARIPFTNQGQHFFRSASVGWHNSFSITLIAHKKVDGHHKILITSLSKKVTLWLLYRIFSPISSMFGMTISE